MQYWKPDYTLRLRSDLAKVEAALTILGPSEELVELLIEERDCIVRAIEDINQWRRECDYGESDSRV